ncbi:MAG: NADH-quinone oxidoreductase subunit D [Planctomycetes bacterium]|nr:NADH-quinone oxidoreductase subunit D [Planctomycetota bacterium]
MTADKSLSKNECSDLVSEEISVNFGPQHPSTHGVFRAVLKLDGEQIVDCESVIGYLHRCAEKTAENVSYVQFHPYTDRLDYIAAMTNNWTYSLAVEKLYGEKLEVPERAEYLRVIIGELQRIASHLLFFATFANDVGAVTPFLYGFREREMCYTLFEELCGQRLNYNFIRVGGVLRDITQEWVTKTYNFLDWLALKLPEYHDILTYNSILLARTSKVGIMTEDIALDYAITGPNLRASGVADSICDRDLRRDEPYSLYKDLFDKKVFNVVNFDPTWQPVQNGDVVMGDVWSRYYSRMLEMEESAKIVRYCLDNLPGGADNKDKLAVNIKKYLKTVKPPAGEAYFAGENPRGELGFYIISDGSDRAVRIKVRSPAFASVSALPAIVRGYLVADFIAILGSVDIVLGEIDR